ncbi:hypothetical protein DFH06DRAFT_1193938 [Mycena polygramma]|nr:hypothetical protein DFH06DRAFT_1193938 [Mycena polygramma]
MIPALNFMMPFTMPKLAYFGQWVRHSLSLLPPPSPSLYSDLHGFLTPLSPPASPTITSCAACHHRGSPGCRITLATWPCRDSRLFALRLRTARYQAFDMLYMGPRVWCVQLQSEPGLLLTKFHSVQHRTGNFNISVGSRDSGRSRDNDWCA